MLPPREVLMWNLDSSQPSWGVIRVWDRDRFVRALSKIILDQGLRYPAISLV